MNVPLPVNPSQIHRISVTAQMGNLFLQDILWEDTCVSGQSGYGQFLWYVDAFLAFGAVQK